MARRASKKRVVASRTSAKRTRTKGGPSRRAGAGAAQRVAPKRTAKKGTAKKGTAQKRGSKARAAKTRAGRAPKPSAAASTLTAVKGAVASAVAAVANRLPGASREADAITLLETDHRRMEELLRRGEDTDERAVAERTSLLDTLTAELNVHELIEEKVLYPALKSHPEARDIVLEGYQEHHVADLIVTELHAVAKDDERWGAKFKVLKESIEHHIKEEEGEMFRTARAIFSRDELRDLGQRMAAMKAAATRRP